MLSKILGIIREIYTAALFGASATIDAYLVALIIPYTMFSMISGALTTTTIPLITEYKDKLGQKSVLVLLNTVTTIMAIVLALLILIGELFAVYIIQIVAPGFHDETLSLAIKLSRILLPMMLFLGLAGLATGILHSQRRFFFPAFIGIPYNICIIIFLLLVGKIWGITGLAVGTLIGIAAQWLFLVPDLRNAGFKFRFILDFSHVGLKKLGKLITPVIIGSGAIQINLVIDRMLASTLVEGSIAALNYASTVNLLAFYIIATPIANVMYPEFSQAIVLEDNEKLIYSLRRSINFIVFIILPFTVGMIILREPLVRVFFERGAFNHSATNLTVFALFFYALGLPAVSLRQILEKVFYSMNDTITPMLIGIGIVVLNIILNLVLIKYLAHGGLALANSIAITCGLIPLFWVLRKKIGNLAGRLILINIAKICLATLIVGLFLYYTFNNILSKFNMADLLMLTICGIFGMLFYFVLIRLLKIEEFDLLINILRNRNIR